MNKLSKLLLLSFGFFLTINGQLPGTALEQQPPITVQTCSAPGVCATKQTTVTVDANWRWAHTPSGTNCYSGNLWNDAICSDPVACTSNCVIEGANTNEYSSTYGITSSGDALSLKFVTKGPYSTNVGSRVYLMEDTNTYQIFKLLNQEFTFDVDDSELDCGLNGALYFVEMDADGGKAAHSGNKAGAKFGTGYCDAQCPHDVKFINGEANSVNWVPSSGDPNSGTGKYGSCCAEMDIWEANKRSTAYTPHSCDSVGPTRCNGVTCGDNASGDRYNGLCDKDGCDFNSFRMGNRSFYGPGKIVDTNSKVTVVTQFITNDGTANGDLVEIRRIYKQHGQVIYNSAATFPSLNGATSLTDEVCDAQKALFGDVNDFKEKRGMKGMGESLKRGMVLALSLWVDFDSNLLWLDSDFPLNVDPSKPGVGRGDCPTTSGVPADVIAKSPNAKVVFSNIKWGPIGSTTDTGSAPTSAPVTQAPVTQPPVTQAPTQKPTQPPTQKPTQPPTQKPTSPPTQKPTQPATQAPVTQAPVTQAPVTQAPVTQAPVTQAPVTQAPVTQAPVTQAPVTQAPVTQAPVTQAPVTQAPVTQAPVTQAPGSCAGSITVTQTQTGGWNDGTNAYTQWVATLSFSSQVYGVRLQSSENLQSFWQLNKQADGSYVPNDWRLNGDLAIPSGSTFEFGYIKVGSQAADFTVASATCESRNKREVVEREMDVAAFEGSASVAQASLFLVAVIIALAL